MAQRDPVRYRAPLLIAAIVLALLAVGGAGVRAATVSELFGSVPAEVPLGRVGAVRTERGGLAQFNLRGPLAAGVLHLGLRPPPRSVLVVEGDRPLDPTERSVQGGLLAMSLKLEGTGGVWVMSGPTSGPALQVFAVLDPDGAEAPDAPAPRGFPSDRVLDALARLAGSESPSWFSQTRLGPWLVPRRNKDVPVLPGCVEQVTGAGLKACARESLAAIWNCLAHHEMSTRAISGALALYLDDGVAYSAAQAAAAGGDCDRVAALKADPASSERARAIIAGVFSEDEALPEHSEAASTDDAPKPPAEGSVRRDRPAEDWAREEELSDLIAGLEDSCAGRGLLEALRRSGDTGLNIKVSLMTHELSGCVEGWTGQLPDESDGDLQDAVLALQELPRGAGCDPVVALMVLIDEWSAREAGGVSTNGASERFVDAFRQAKKERGGDLEDWLPDRFPLLYDEARRVLRHLE